MSKRKVIKIDEDICNGCGLCIPNCPEGALKIIDGKARLISDLFCDGLGACIGNCPLDAITIEEREAEEYDEIKVMENIVKKGENTIKEHLDHLKDHGETELYNQAIKYLHDHDLDIPQLKEKSEVPEGCPGCAVINIDKEHENVPSKTMSVVSELKNWPIQLMLIPENAPYFKNADLLIAADCVSFSLGNFHDELLKNKVLMIGCPKLDNSKFYLEKLTNIFKINNINSVTTAYMEVPCCFGMVAIVQEAIMSSGKEIPLINLKVSIKGKIIK